MRKVLGGAVIVAGVVGTGWYGTKFNAHTMQAEITAAAQEAAEGTIHPITSHVVGRDIIVSGIANSDAERDQILTRMNDLDGRRVVRDDLQVLETASPFVFKAVKTDDGTAHSGMTPTEADREVLAKRIGGDAAQLALMAGAPDANWMGVVDKGLTGLGALEGGTLSIEDKRITLTGEALTPVEQAAMQAALADLPDGYETAFDITLLDDGTPPRFDVVYKAADGVSINGKLPADTDIESLASALGLETASGDAAAGLLGEIAPTPAQLTALSRWLPDLEELTYARNDAQITVEAVASPGVSDAYIQAGLAEALGADGADAVITVTTARDLPAEGTTRTNQATRGLEALTRGYWLPVVDFVSDMDSCNGQSAAALQSHSIAFVTGSAELDAQSVRAINSVASIVLKCSADTDLSVEIGGHTDSQGGEDLNQQLSKDRAAAVRTALIDRGVADAKIIAQGYGEAEPIADNETPEGRAANRRTTITWFTPVIEEPAATPQDTGVQDTGAQDTGSQDDATQTDTNTDVGE